MKYRLFKGRPMLCVCVCSYRQKRTVGAASSLESCILLGVLLVFRRFHVKAHAYVSVVQACPDSHASMRQICLSVRYRQTTDAEDRDTCVCRDPMRLLLLVASAVAAFSMTVFAVKIESNTAQQWKSSKFRSQSEEDELPFPIVLPPYHKNEKYPVSKSPPNFGNCLLYLEGITVLVHKTESNPAYVAALVGSNETHKYLFAKEDVQCRPTSGDNLNFENVNGNYSFDITVKIDPKGVVAFYGKSAMFKVVDKIRFRLVFNTPSPQTWELANVELAEITVSTVGTVTEGSFLSQVLKISEPISARPKYLNVYSTDSYAYGCSDTQAVFFPVETKKYKYQVGIAFHNFQVELYGVYRNEEKNEIKFSRNVNDCVGTFSTGSIMGIIVAVVLATILLLAFLMLNSVQTMDRFDDPKQKQININVRE
uniref:Ac45-VOA1_TM domain-containing protein n=1 Tax=Steinernema glaseri TaxID=37863 RepID=A0A1I7Z1N5_9BILA